MGKLKFQVPVQECFSFCHAFKPETHCYGHCLKHCNSKSTSLSCGRIKGYQAFWPVYIDGSQGVSS